MDRLAVTDDEFDALLDASSLGAPHVVAETGVIPSTARIRMAQAARNQQRLLGDTVQPDDTSVPQPVDELLPDHCPGATGGGAQTPQYECTVPDLTPRQESRIFLYTATGAGKSVISIALFAWLHKNGFGIGRNHRRVPHAQRLACEPRLGNIRAVPWLLLSPPYAGGDRGGPPRLSVLGDTWLAMPNDLLRFGRPAPMCRFTFEYLKLEYLKTAAFAMQGCEQALPLFSPLTSTCTVLKPHAVDWVGSGQRKPQLQDVQQLVQSSAHLIETTSYAAHTELLVCTMRSAVLHMTRFADFAYKAVSSGLLLPKAACTPGDHHPVDRNDGAGRDLRQRALPGRARLWKTTTHGVREVCSELPMSVHPDERESLVLTPSLPTRLTYRVSDPYAVEVRFGADTRDETVWTFARDLLRSGLERTSGLGDVIVWPDTRAGSERRVYIRLTSPEGTALLSAADGDLRAFTEAAGGLIAYGTEHSYLAPALNVLERKIGELARPGGRD
ncbi:SsgA family sporulation/cell division regulator [Streptomyces sp. NPDC127105]|uniref:SsgA family sporulation/cell division regulator n=1 Tax=Streptomyces sp. NPDC127105 TaxID=3345359 RepID=UPI003647772C